MGFFSKAAPLCKTVQLQMKESQPMNLTYYLGEESHGFLRYMLAPKDDD